MAKFPAKFLSQNDIGQRIKVRTTGHAVIEDVLATILVGVDAGKSGNVLVKFENVPSDGYDSRYFEVDPESMVKRCG